MTDSDWPRELTELDENNFERVMAKYQNVVIDCWAPWCGPCLALEPVIKELAEEFKGKVFFAKMNTDENLEVARKLGIMSLPTILYFRNGQYEDRIMGSVHKHVIKEKVEELVVPG